MAQQVADETRGVVNYNQIWLAMAIESALIAYADQRERDAYERAASWIENVDPEMAEVIRTRAAAIRSLPGETT